MTLVTVNGAFGLIGTCFIPAPASRMLVCLYLVPSYVQMFFQLVGRLAKFTGSLCLSEDAGHSHPPEKRTWEMLMLCVWGELKVYVDLHRSGKKDPDQTVE